MKLAIISHTNHFRQSDGRIVGWGPTVREINHLLEIFDEIWHIAVLQPGKPPSSSLPYSSKKIHFVAIAPFGGNTLKKKLTTLIYAPKVIQIVSRVLQKVDWWQFRAPTGIGVFLIPWLSLFVNKPGWFKYAGNWVQKNPPIGYAFQRLWLSKLQSRKVTINGRWVGQPKHCLSFENPCISEEEHEQGREVIRKKAYRQPLAALFVGRLEDAKGVSRILRTFQENHWKNKIQVIHFVGDGPNRKHYEKLAQSMSIESLFHGFLSREDVARLMADCQLFLLPSDSEGFPKVLAEAWNYGAVPVVSEVSAISQYLGEKNGYLWPIGRIGFEDFLRAQDLSRATLRSKAESGSQIAWQFTFKNYHVQLQKWVIQC